MTASSKSADAGAWKGTLLTGRHTVELHTSKGLITLELDADASPKTVTNFVTLAESGFYDHLTFHRVIPGFMIQGGDPHGDGSGGRSIYGTRFEDEIDPGSPLYKIGYKKGVVAMANAGPNTNGSQFFIMDADYGLPPNYTIFGRVINGQAVVHAIATVETDSSRMKAKNPGCAAEGTCGNDRPVESVTFTAKVLK